MVLVVLSLIIWSGCSRQDIMPEVQLPERAESEEDRLRDSVYIYTYLLYLWQDDLPTSFQTRRYTTAENLLEALKTYARDPQGNIYDRFSFLDRSGTVDEELQQGLAGAFGLFLRYDNDTDLYIRQVDPGSPASAAGISRGHRVLEINGNANLTVANMDADNFAWLDAALNAQSISLRLRRSDGTEFNATVQRGSYQIQPILARSVYTVGSKKVGYFAFDVFVSTSNNAGGATYVRNQLNQLFQEFEGEGVDELIVDLRYNGGGAVITADYLSNMLAPTSVGNGLMYTYRINNTLTEAGFDTIFGPEYFNKTNSLNLDRIYFLVTGSTASASELLINNLRPHMDVKLIGENATYGKPVGYFGWDIMGVDLYAVSFQTFNSQGFGDYFSGLPVDKLVYDDVTRAFGDPDEALIAEALNYARTGGFSAVSATNLEMNTRLRSRNTTRSPGLNQFFDGQSDRGMYNFKSQALVIPVN